MRSTPATRAAVRARGVPEMRSGRRLFFKDPFTLSRPVLRSGRPAALYGLRRDDEGGRDVWTHPGVLAPGCATKSIRPKGPVERALSIGDRAIAGDELSPSLFRIPNPLGGCNS
jgi:hypothetical protein